MLGTAKLCFRGEFIEHGPIVEHYPLFRHPVLVGYPERLTADEVCQFVNQSRNLRQQGLIHEAIANVEFDLRVQGGF